MKIVWSHLLEVLLFAMEHLAMRLMLLRMNCGSQFRRTNLFLSVKTLQKYFNLCLALVEAKARAQLLFLLVFSLEEVKAALVTLHTLTEQKV